MEDLIKTIESCKEVYVDVPLVSTSIWVKADKKFLIEQLRSKPDMADEFEIVSKYGRSSIYLSRRL